MPNNFWTILAFERQNYPRVEDDVKRSRGRMLTRREGRVEKNIAQESPFFSAQFTSYWDCLPPELRLPIKEMAIKQ